MQGSDQEFDYVIVGGGSAGCTLAGRLTEDESITVCLLEAGPGKQTNSVRMPAGIMDLMKSDSYNWKFETAPQKNLNNRRMFWPRGRTLGGSSAINAMVYIRGHKWDYDHWASLGNAGWGYDDVLPIFRRSQNQERGGDDFHGAGGPLNVADLRSPNPLAHILVDAAVETQIRRNDDFNGAEQEGAGLYQVTQKDGQRCSAYHAFLEGRERQNLFVVDAAHATRVLLDGKRATGVEYRRGDDTLIVRARREVILSGGAVNSPQLLQLSGIGAGVELSQHGIEVAHELPGVGENLQDHLDLSTVCSTKDALGFAFTAKGLGMALKGLYQYATSRTGLLTSNFAESGAFVRSHAGAEVPDLQLHFLPVVVDDHGRNRIRKHGATIHMCELRPKSRGRIGLNTPDPLAPPMIDPNYLDHPDDMETMLRGVKICRQISEAPSFARHRDEELFPGPSVQSDDELRDYIRQKAETIYHPVGTCKMGSDDMAVVDSSLKVRGMDGLRVVDASVMPTLVGGNTNAPTIMIAEKASDMIRAG